jgi:ribosomal-protein-alanine N-acetyltransferase
MGHRARYTAAVSAVVLETARLRLRPFVREDAADHRRLYSDPDVTRYLGGGPFVGEEAERRSARTLDHFIRHWADRGFGVWAVLDRTSGRIIGQCGLNRLPERDDIEVLYALERAAWGRGLAGEAALVAVRYGFEAVGLDRIVAVVRHANAGSRRVLDKLGMRYEGDVEVYGVVAACYALTAVEFGVGPDRAVGAP